MKRIFKVHSTKPERIVYEILKKHHLPFKFRWLIKGREVDFLVGKTVIEIQDHIQDPEKNKMIVEAGYNLLYLTNKEIYEDKNKVEKHILQWLKPI